jgi:DNA-binding IclR family transcriptional regulator
MGGNYFINSIQRAFDILELFSYNERELGISEIARRMDLHKSTVHRIVTTLENRGVLEQNPGTEKYRLGLKLYRLGLVVHDDNELIAVTEPSLKKLTDKTGETSNLVLIDGSKAVYIAQRESDRMIRMFTKPGVWVYPHCSGAGKVLLSEMDEEGIQSIIDANGFPCYTENTILSKKELLEELRKVRDRGYAMDNGEREEGVMCIAAPVRDRHGCIVASISISGPSARFGEERLGLFIEQVKGEALAVSRRLGFCG